MFEKQMDTGVYRVCKRNMILLKHSLYLIPSTFRIIPQLFTWWIFFLFLFIYGNFHRLLHSQSEYARKSSRKSHCSTILDLLEDHALAFPGRRKKKKKKEERRKEKKKRIKDKRKIETKRSRSPRGSRNAATRKPKWESIHLRIVFRSRKG